MRAITQLRTTLMVAAALVAAAATAVSAQGSKAGACPSDARQASRQVWPELSRGETVTATHPCGRKISCTGGAGDEVRRKCKWG